MNIKKKKEKAGIRIRRTKKVGMKKRKKKTTVNNNNNNNSNNNNNNNNNNQQKKKRICRIAEFAVPADHRIKLKECEKEDKYLDLARELKKPWNMKVTIVPIVTSALGIVTKGLLKGLEDSEVGRKVETIQTTALLRTTRILRRVLEV